MAATSKAGFGHADRSCDGGEALDSDTSASEELAATRGVEDSFEWRRRAEADVCGDNSLVAAARDLVASLARALVCDGLGTTGRNMVTLLALEDSFLGSSFGCVKTEKNALGSWTFSRPRPVFWLLSLTSLIVVVRNIFCLEVTVTCVTVGVTIKSGRP